jgi:peptide/nickel transport system substrate-binding protein
MEQIFVVTLLGQGPSGLLPGKALVLKKNEQYFEKDSAGNPLPYLDGIKVSFYDSKATEFLLFRQKELEFK